MKRQPRLATVHDADEIARLLHEFNTEFETPSPGPQVLRTRLARLLATDSTIAILVGGPAVGVALVTVRSNVWYDGGVALLDELYVQPERRGQGIGSAIIDALHRHAVAARIDAIEINVDEGDVDAQRFYERHGYTCLEPDTGERAFFYFRELVAPT